jgi:hypothetical protein
MNDEPLEYDEFGQPSINCISKLFGIAIELEGIAGAQSQAIIDLRNARNKRTTWFDKEIKLMHAVDKYLESRGGR